MRDRHDNFLRNWLGLVDVNGWVYVKKKNYLINNNITKNIFLYYINLTESR